MKTYGTTITKWRSKSSGTLYLEIGRNYVGKTATIWLLALTRKGSPFSVDGDQIHEQFDFTREEYIEKEEGDD